MKIYTELNEKKNLSLALGYFDGIHKGHQSVIKNAVDFANLKGCKSAIITFNDHPCCYFYGVCPKYILTREERRQKISDLGIDYLYELDFPLIAKMPAEKYLKEVLIKYFTPLAISTGFNHHFGADQSGDTQYLEKMSSVFNYKYFLTNAEKEGNNIISSTEIRKNLSGGNIEQANKMLGYNFYINGKVIRGQQLGRKLGFRTANLLYPQELIDLPFGVYATLININKVTYKGITNFGIRPTVSSNNSRYVETHILDFNKDIYDQNITIEFTKMIRKEKKFSNLEELKLQIKKDISTL